MFRFGPILASALLLAGQGGVALADTCLNPTTKTKSAKSRDCPPAAKVEPYDPDRVKAGRNPGFIDLGNGTEVRIGGRARMDFDTRR